MKKGFTLAEILISLAVIGIVAALTLPALINNYKEKSTVIKLKKIYSTLSNAYNLALIEHGSYAQWVSSDKTKLENQRAFFNSMKPYLKISKVCEFEEGCLTKDWLKTLDGRNYNMYDQTQEYKFVLNDGTSVWFYVNMDSMNGNIKVDIDGKKGPFVFGKDVFIFDISSKGISPSGCRNTTYTENTGELTTFEEFCNIDKQSYANGQACAGWVIENDNMDYLHCSDLSWDGKHKCSEK